MIVVKRSHMYVQFAVCRYFISSSTMIFCVPAFVVGRYNSHICNFGPHDFIQLLLMACIRHHQSHNYKEQEQSVPNFDMMKLM